MDLGFGRMRIVAASMRVVLVFGSAVGCGGSVETGSTGGALSLEQAEADARAGNDPLTMLIVFGRLVPSESHRWRDCLPHRRRLRRGLD
jgi:hypothetical protein